MTALTEPAAADEPCGHDARRAVRVAWHAVLTLHGDRDAAEWAEFAGDGFEPVAGDPLAVGTDPR